MKQDPLGDEGCRDGPGQDVAGYHDLTESVVISFAVGGIECTPRQRQDYKAKEPPAMMAIEEVCV